MNTDFIASLLAPRISGNDAPLNIVDGGASIGETVQAFCSTFPHATVFAIEPFPESIDRLRTRFGDNEHVRLIPSALGDESGTAQLHLCAYPPANSLLPFDERINHWADASDIHENNTIPVEVMTLDQVAEDAGMGQIDILKLDLQGGEGAALRGAEGLLRREAISLLYLEVPFQPLYLGQPEFWEIQKYLSDFEYSFVSFEGITSSEGGFMRWADALFICPSLFEIWQGKHRASSLT